jgi:iron complex outermembrane receptor protein
MKNDTSGQGVTIGQKHGTRPVQGRHCVNNAPLKSFYHKKGGEKTSKRRFAMERMTRRFVLILFGLILCTSAGLAQEPQKETTLEEIVVTATKTEKKVEDAPGSITIVTQEDLKKQNIETLDDALDTLSGIFVKRNKGLTDTTASVRMRGFNNDQYTLILLDGQPLNDAYSGGLEWGILPVSNIERIEVIRGAASALYGGNAMGGVINIITKTPKKLELQANAGYGTYSTAKYGISAGNRFWDRLSLSFGFDGIQTNGYATTPVVSTISSGAGNVSGGYPMNDQYGNPTRWVVGDKGKNGAEDLRFNGRASFDFSDTGKVSFTGIWGHHEYDYGPPNTEMGTFGDNTTYANVGPGQRARFRPSDFISSTGIGQNETAIYTLSFEEAIGPVKIHAQAGAVIVNDRYTLPVGTGLYYYDNSPGSLKITESKAWPIELRGDLPIGRSHILTMGASFRLDTSDTNDYDIPFYRSYDGKGPSTFYSGGKSQTYAVFAQDEWRLFDPLTLYLGLRYDWWKVYNGASGVPGSEIDYDSNKQSEFSPKIAVVWKALANTTLRGSVGHAFRPPTLYELFRTWTSSGITYVSNPNLEPETVWTYEAGIDQYFFDKRTRISLTGYLNMIDNLIYFKTQGSIRERINAGQSRTYGLELELSQKITNWLSVWGNFTFTDARIMESPTDPASVWKQVTGIPKYTSNAGLDVYYKWFKGSLVGRYFSKIYNNSNNTDTENGVYGTYEPAFFVDGKLTVTPLKWVEISLSMNNIFNKKYWEYYAPLGRTLLGECTLRY